MRDFPIKRAPLMATALVSLVLAGGCTDKVPPPAPVVTTSQTPDSVQVVFTARCAKPGCHVTGTAAFDEFLAAGQSFAATVNVPSGEVPALARIRPFQPDSSYLVKKIRGDADIRFARMPFDGPPYLTPAESSTVVNWVKEGAPGVEVPVAPARIGTTAMR
jgi:hypothetical protein